MGKKKKGFFDKKVKLGDVFDFVIFSFFMIVIFYPVHVLFDRIVESDWTVIQEVINLNILSNMIIIFLLLIIAFWIIIIATCLLPKLIKVSGGKK